MPVMSREPRPTSMAEPTACRMTNVDTEAHPGVHFADMAHHDIRIAKLFILGAMVVDSDVDGVFLRQPIE